MDNLNLGPEEQDAGIAPGGERFNEEMTDHVEPAQHGDRIPSKHDVRAEMSSAPHFEPPPNAGQPAAMPGFLIATGRESRRTGPFHRRNPCC